MLQTPLSARCVLHTTPLVEGKCQHCGPPPDDKPKVKAKGPFVLSPEALTRITLLNTFVAVCTARKTYSFGEDPSTDSILEVLAEKLGYPKFTRNTQSIDAIKPALKELAVWAKTVPQALLPPPKEG